MLHVMCYQGVNELVGGNLLFVTIFSSVGVKVLGILEGHLTLPITRKFALQL